MFKRILLVIILVMVVNTWCLKTGAQDREDLIPADQIKITPEADVYPPMLNSSKYEKPVQLSYPLNTAGMEDSPFMMPDGNTLYLWYSPDEGADAVQQIYDGVTGIWVSNKNDEEWSVPERVLLQDPGKPALDGAFFVQDNEAWFGSIREGYDGINWYTAELIDDQWQNWEYAGDRINQVYVIGEMHITADWQELYFHRPRTEPYDIWVSKKQYGLWQTPEPVDVVNSSETDGWPYISQDGKELWFTRVYQGSPAIFKSKKLDGEWQEPELIIYQFAGEPSLDNNGHIYFTHAFYENNIRLESDIYVAYNREPGIKDVEFDPDTNTVTWATYMPATSQVKWGLDADQLDNETELDSALTYEHSAEIDVILEELDAIYYKVMSEDGSASPMESYIRHYQAPPQNCGFIRGRNNVKQVFIIILMYMFVIGMITKLRQRIES